MAKLNKTEVYAISSKIYREIKNNVNEKNNIIHKEACDNWEKEFKETEDYKLLKEFCENSERLEELTKGLSYSNRVDKVSFDELMCELSLKRTKSNLKSLPDFKLIEEEIIINQAMNNDIESLVTALIEKYS